MLKHWKNPNYQPEGAPAGDFVALLCFILKNRSSDVSTMKINDVNSFLDSLSKSTTTDEKTNILAKLVQKASLLEQKWINYIILKDLKIGFGHETLFKNLDPRALDVYNATSSLREVCNFLIDPKNPKYSHSFFQIFSPIKPMLAGRLGLKQIMTQFSSVTVFIETKYDGERIQCHIHQDEIKFFTRNAIDYTYLYSKLAEPIKRSVLCKSAILDGEIVVWDNVKGNFAAFGENKPTAKQNDDEDKSKDKQLCCKNI